EALQAAGLPVRTCDGGTRFDGNKRLAVVGDAAMKTVHVMHWHSGNETRGRVFMNLRSNKNLDRVGTMIHLGNHINKNPSQGNSVPPTTMADTVEAILGVVLKDSDLDHVALVMRNIGLMS
ncbi:uncharacterized protein BDZ99DRAFT_396037, partial [Mytilinidion resinicola]